MTGRDVPPAGKVTIGYDPAGCADQPLVFATAGSHVGHLLDAKVDFGKIARDSAVAVILDETDFLKVASDVSFAVKMDRGAIDDMVATLRGMSDSLGGLHHSLTLMSKRLPARVRPKPKPECPWFDAFFGLCTHSKADHARLRRRRTAKLRERRRALRRNTAHLRKYGHPPRRETHLPRVKFSNVDPSLSRQLTEFRAH